MDIYLISLTKEQTKIELGVCPQQGKRKDIDVIRDLIRDGKRLREIVEVASSYQAIRTAEKIFEHKENKRRWPTEVYWYHGPTGSGKSRKAYLFINIYIIINLREISQFS